MRFFRVGSLCAPWNSPIYAATIAQMRAEIAAATAAA
jgi:hypothetical protein